MRRIQNWHGALLLWANPLEVIPFDQVTTRLFCRIRVGKVHNESFLSRAPGMRILFSTWDVGRRAQVGTMIDAIEPNKSRAIGSMINRDNFPFLMKVGRNILAGSEDSYTIAKFTDFLNHDLNAG